MIGGQPVLGESLIHLPGRFGVEIFQKHAEIAVRRDREDAVGHDMRAPKITMRVEGDAVDEAAGIGGAKGLAPGGLSVIVDAQPGDAA